MPSPKRIGKIEFGLLSPKEIRKMSVRKIIWADTYDEDGYPYPQGLMDLALGVIDPGLRCKTCDQKASDCPGHFGHIELAKPVIHVGYTRLIRKLLRVTCRACSRLLLESVEIEKVLAAEEESPGGDILKEKDIKKERLCPHCGEQQLKINFEKPTTFSEIWTEDGRRMEHKLDPRGREGTAREDPDEDLRLLGINPDVARPEWTILTVLPVPPVTMRPSIILENGQRSEDDLTHKLVDIIRINQRFKENQDAGAPHLIIEDLWELLQYHVTTYLDNEVAGCPPARHRSGRPLKTLSQRLKGKDGRFRGSLSGKRVNFSARTVISPDPNIRVTEVGIPLAIAREMTIPVRVTQFNKAELVEYIMKGPDRATIHSPVGANYVIRPDNRRLRLSDANLETVVAMVEPGWTVERQLRDGDIVLFNRQPSLHRMSIMAHRVRVMDGKTFRLNPAVCPPYNADFDGDEMNLHVPQTEEAKAEAQILLSVEENILSPRFGGPIIGGIHDHVSGIFMLTHGLRHFTKPQVIYLLMHYPVERMPEPEKEVNGVPALVEQAGPLLHPAPRAEHGLQGVVVRELRGVQARGVRAGRVRENIRRQARIGYHRQEGNRGLRRPDPPPHHPAVRDEEGRRVHRRHDEARHPGHHARRVLLRDRRRGPLPHRARADQRGPHDRFDGRGPEDQDLPGRAARAHARPDPRRDPGDADHAGPGEGQGPDG